MKSAVPLAAIQNGEFEILKYIRDICDQNGLLYFLAYGTLIGAVRHQDFVPWDDDMDIHMPREDYLKLVDFIKKNPHPYFRLISPETSPTFKRTTAKMIDSRTRLMRISRWAENVPLGIYVDIFLLDGAGNTREEAEAAYDVAYSIYLRLRKAGKKMFYKQENGFVSFARWIYHIPERFRGSRYWINEHISYCRQKSYYDYEFVAAMGACTRRASRNVWKRESFGDGTDVLFRGEVFRAPSDWDAVLRPEYGNYMVPPPPEKQKSHHKYTLEISDPAVLEELLHGKSSN